MRFDDLIRYFLPTMLKGNASHPDYHEIRAVLSAILIGLPLVLLFPAVLYFIGRPVTGFLINAVLLVTTLFSIKNFAHYRIPMSITALVTYYIIYSWIKDTGLIYSSNLCMLHMYLLAAILADKKYGWYAVFTNILLFILIYYQTIAEAPSLPIDAALGSPLYALVMNALITIFFGGFLAYLQMDQERDRRALKALQEQKITILDRAVKKRTEQLNTMREALATDFHDETGNMLSAINRQAAVLKLRLGTNPQLQPIVESIVHNSNALYSASKDFLWHLNHDSDDPTELFHYLTAYGQYYYNQFDIAFSALEQYCSPRLMDPQAAINLIYIFKEAMTNVVKHAQASEVTFEMECLSDQVIYLLKDNGSWRIPEDHQHHYGLENIKKRCEKNRFVFSMASTPLGTQLKVNVKTPNAAP